MSDIQAYLASKYMSGARADAILSRSEAGRPKKKKRRIDQAVPVAVGDGTGLLIADEDNLGNAWGQAEPEEEDTDAPVVTAAAKTLRLKKSNWSLPSASSSTQPEPAAEDPPAGSSTATATSAPPVKKRKGGLLTAAQLKEEAEALAIEEARKEAEREQERLEARRRRRAEGIEDDEDLANDDNDDDHPDHQRTVYRDRSGKIVDAQAERAEQLKAEAEDRARQAAKKDWNKGLVQRNQREVEAQRERQVASTSFARSANDRDMNDELRNEVRREDPAAAFLTKRKKKGPQRPKYTGPAPPPNRFGILPGFRWDGVDRSTGYEAKLFQKINERSRKAREAYQWSTEEM